MADWTGDSSGFLGRDSHGIESTSYYRPDFICSVVEVKREGLQHIKVEPAAEIVDFHDPNQSDLYSKSDFICPIVEVKPEVLEDVKVEAVDECDVRDLNNYGFYCGPDFICPVVEVKQDMEDMKMEATDENDVRDPGCFVKVRLSVIHAHVLTVMKHADTEMML